MAKFIVIDGLDGCGKATQTDLLKKALEKKGFKVATISFPNYNSLSSAPVTMYLKGELGLNAEDINTYMVSTFYAVDRYIQYVMDWQKLFEEDDNTVILADRYISANIIHQGGKIGNRQERFKYTEWGYNTECDICGLPREDVTILLTMEPKISQKLISNRYNQDESKKDIHESNIEYLNNCYTRILETFQDMTTQTNNIKNTWININCADTINNEPYSIDKIHNLILDIAMKILTNKKIEQNEFTFL